MDSQGSPSRRTATFVDTITFAAPSRRHSRIRRLVASLIESWSSTARAFLNRARSRSPARVLGHPVGHARGEGDASIVARRLGSRQVGCLQPWSPPAGGTSSRVVTLRCCGGGVPSDLPRECSGQTSAVDAPRLVRFGREPDPAGVGGQRPRRRPRAATWNRSPTIFGESGTTRSSGPGFVETLSVRRAPAITVARSRGAAHPHPGEAGLRRRGVARRVRACVSIGKPPRWVSAVTVHGLRGQSVSPPPVSCALTVAALCVLDLRTPPEGSGQRPRRRLGAAGAGSAGRSRRTSSGVVVVDCPKGAYRGRWADTTSWLPEESTDGPTAGRPRRPEAGLPERLAAGGTNVSTLPARASLLAGRPPLAGRARSSSRHPACPAPRPPAQSAVRLDA